MSRGRWSILAASSTVAVVVSLACGLVGPGAATAPSWIVFSAYADGGGATQLFRVQPNGVGLDQITTGKLPAVSPSFSRSGAKVAFSRLGSGIFTMNPNGSGLRRLTSNGRDGYPVWSPDGTQIAFVRLVGVQWRAFVMSSSGSNEHRLAQAPPAGRASWTSNGKSILMPAGGDLVQVDAKTGHVQKYVGLPIDTQTGQTATVSPNGRLVAYVGPRISTGPPDCGEGRCPQFGLYLASLPVPHRTRRIVNDTGAAGWSPDGKRLAFVAKGVLTLRNVATGAQTVISTDTHVATGDAPPAWH
ncbi:MAG: TolB protein [Gaiellaceae bacterium]|nr:TolB protein [Gaiellaceae bacterium]